jgi:hypothetical protein
VPDILDVGINCPVISFKVIAQYHAEV